MTDVVDALLARVRRRGPQPLLTYYDLDRQERTELSAVSFANWVDKTCHLLDGLGLAPGDGLAVPVVTERAGHWVGLIAVMAGWQLGAHVTSEPGAGIEVAIVGPGHPWAVVPPGGLSVVACSLHPLGLPLRPPAPVIDFAEVLAEPDAPLRHPHLADDPAWEEWTYGALAAVEPQPGRVLVRAPDARLAVVAGLVAPLLGGGSAVVVTGAGDVARTAADERVDVQKPDPDATTLG